MRKDVHCPVCDSPFEAMVTLGLDDDVLIVEEFESVDTGTNECPSCGATLEASISAEIYVDLEPIETR
jgi:hypothetical protein